MAVRQTNSKIPRSRENDYTQDAAAGRREFLRDRTGVTLEHVSECSFDPSVAQGNVENFIGVAQVEKYSSPDPLLPLQLHDRRRRRAEPDRKGHRGRV